jgi:hypothetical protein
MKSRGFEDESRGPAQQVRATLALADNPPSGTFYDADHATNTTRLASLGVHEHWNNLRDKQYSRNLGKREGIELVRVGPSAT